MDQERIQRASGAVIPCTPGENLNNTCDKHTIVYGISVDTVVK